MSFVSYTIDRTFPAPPSRLYRAFTVASELEAWVWGANAPDARARVDARIGGAVEVTVAGATASEARSGFRGVFADVVPGRRLVYTVHWDANVGYNGPGKDPVDEVLVVEIEPVPAGSRLRYSHLGIPADSGGAATEHERSVRATLEDLAAHVAKHP